MSSAILIAYLDTSTERDAATKTQQFLIDRIPAVLYGEHAEQLWLFLHGQMGHKEEAESFAKIVCPKGAQVLGIDLPGHGARQGRDEELNPWTVVPELQAVMDWARVRWSPLGLHLPPCQQHRRLLCHARF